MTSKEDRRMLNEVSPPGWGHTKAEKEKTKPNKPKSKIGGSAAAFKRALDDGRFKGLPGSKTKKEKTADMFKLMWSMKKKGDKPHYKPGTDKKYKKYQDESFEIDTSAHKKAQKKAKMRNLAKGNTNPNEKAAAEKKAGGPKLYGEALSTKDAKKLNKASVLDQSKDPKDWESARARRTEIDYKDLVRQIKAKKKMKEDIEYTYPNVRRNPRFSTGSKMSMTPATGIGAKKSTKNNPAGDDIRNATYNQIKKLERKKAAQKRKTASRIVGIKKMKEDWKPEIEHVKGSDLRKKAAEKKRKKAADSLPPHLKLDVMKKAFSHTNEEASYKQRDKALKKSKKAMDFRHKTIHKGGDDDVNEATTMKDNNLFGNAYAGSYETLKKKIGSKKKHNKPAIKEGISYKDFMSNVQKGIN